MVSHQILRALVETESKLRGREGREQRQRTDCVRPRTPDDLVRCGRKAAA